MTTTRELPRTWSQNNVVYHEAYGKRTTAWVDCVRCNKRQPAGTETLTAYGGAEVTRVEHLSSQWAKPQIGRCNVCHTRGPLVEVNIYVSGPIVTSHCDRRCLDAHGDQCNCRCEGRDHGAGVCTCGKETA